MDVTASRDDSRQPPVLGPPPAEVVWHDLECGGYSADLSLWRELAEQSATPAGSAPIVEVGAGTGRVTLDLARRGHAVTALDVRADLLGALQERAAGMAVETVCADARGLELGSRDFALGLVPMQTLQLFGGSAARMAFLTRARAHLRPGALLACAIVTAIEPFDCASGDVSPAAETARVAGSVYISRAVSVRVRMRSIVIERERLILAGDGGAAPASPAERDLVELDRVTVAKLEQEALEVGLRPAGRREIPATDDHVGSTVVMLAA